MVGEFPLWFSELWTWLVPWGCRFDPWLRIHCCWKLQRRSRMQLYRTLLWLWLWLWCRPSSCSSNSTPGLGTSICHRCSTKKKKKKKKNPCNEPYEFFFWWVMLGFSLKSLCFLRNLLCSSEYPYITEQCVHFFIVLSLWHPLCFP